MARLVSEPEAAQIHVVFMGAGLQPEALQKRIDGTRWSKVVAFRPTGTYKLTVSIFTCIMLSISVEGTQWTKPHALRPTGYTQWEDNAFQA